MKRISERLSFHTHKIMKIILTRDYYVRIMSIFTKQIFNFFLGKRDIKRVFNINDLL